MEYGTIIAHLPHIYYFINVFLSTIPETAKPKLNTLLRVVVVAPALIVSKYSNLAPKFQGIHKAHI